MASYGLLGAIGGLGQAMQTHGKNIMERRERALAEAKAMAAEQRKEARDAAKRQEDRDFTLTTLDIKESRQDARTSATLEARAAEKKEDREFKVADREDTQEHTAEQKRLDREAAAARQREAAKLQGSKEAANIRLREQITSKQVAGVKYGERKPDDPDYVRILIIRKDGTVEKTAGWSYRPQKTEEQDDDSL